MLGGGDWLQLHWAGTVLSLRNIYHGSKTYFSLAIMFRNNLFSQHNNHNMIDSMTTIMFYEHHHRLQCLG